MSFEFFREMIQVSHPRRCPQYLRAETLKQQTGEAIKGISYTTSCECKEEREKPRV